VDLIARARQKRWHLAGHYSRPLPAPFTDALRGARALEIGGPSPCFLADGVLPLYGLVASVDGVQFATETVWHGRMDEGEYRPEGAAARGRLWIADGATLAGVPEGAFDAVVASHVIEHIANPLRALEAWRRAGRQGSWLLVVAPHGSQTFDHRRPVTTLEHMVSDHARGVGEDDLTHLEETLALHDRARDLPMTDEEFAAPRRDNPRTRLLHHHVFTTGSLLALLDHAGLEIVAVETRRPQDVYVLGRWAEAPDNAAMLARDAPWRRRSLFRADRRG